MTTKKLKTGPTGQKVPPLEPMVFLDGNSLSTSDISRLAKDPSIQLAISPLTAERIQASRKLLDKFMDEKKVIYGVNTGLGGFVNWLVPTEFAQELQENLIAAVATNVGSYLDHDVVRASMLVRLNSLARGCSAISLENFNKLLSVYNAGIVPCIPSKGSLGASGDLGPLSCIALVCVGKWKAVYKGQTLSGDEALRQAGIEPMILGYKEGLSLINGTSVMTGFAALLVEQSIKLVETFELISCLTFEALNAKIDPFNPIVHKQKPHPDQLSTAETIWRTLSDSKMISRESVAAKHLESYAAASPTATNYPIEDAYSIRCTPHILGPIKASLSWIKSVVTNEINSSNDNPLVIPGHPEAFHNGHFHGQYISMAMDHLSIALTTLSNLSDRRIDRLLDKNNSNGLPPFLCKESPGLRLGLMGGQFMAASLTSENRSLCNPVSIQSLTSTGDFQDIVSLGLVAARRAQEIYTNAAYVIAFELLCGAQAAEIRGSHLLSPVTGALFKNTRKIVPYLSTDQSLTNHLEGLAQFIKTGVSMDQTKENTTDLDARYYVKHSSLQKGLAKNILDNFPISSKLHILDVGCGDGRITAEIANRAQEGKVIGIDVSPSMVDFATRNFPPPEHPNLRFQLAMAEDVKFTEKFDLIVSFSCFHWLKNPQKAFRRLSAALKPGGEMLILTYPKESHYYSYLETALKQHPEYAALSAHKTMLPIKGYKKLLLKNQFEIIDFKQHELSAEYSTPEEIQKYIKGWLNSYVPLPEQLYDSFLEEVCRAVLSDPTTRKDKKINMPYTALVIRARKIAE